MRLKITLGFSGTLLLPVHYNQVVQGLIYHSLSTRLATWLHTKGYNFENRTFRNFTFSRLFGKFERRDSKLLFRGPVSFWLTSPNEDIISEFAATLLRTELQLHGQVVSVDAIEVDRHHIQATQVDMTMLSPMTAYHTVETEDGRKRTDYVSPLTNEFGPMICENLRRKYLSFYPDARLPESLQIVPIHVDPVRDKKIVKYKDFIVEGWMGRYRLTGPVDVLQFAYLAGLGSKNAQGFGCWVLYGVADGKNNR